MVRQGREVGAEDGNERVRAVAEPFKVAFVLEARGPVRLGLIVWWHMFGREWQRSGLRDLESGG